MKFMVIVKANSDTEAGVMPVSYTHLDVYKRQLKVGCDVHRNHTDENF